MKTKRTQGRSICDRQKKQDSKICGIAVVALQILGKVSGLSVRAFHKICNTAALDTQS